VRRKQPTKIATASEDDTSPVVMLWDLRNPRAPEKVRRMHFCALALKVIFPWQTLTGHQSGILGMDWSQADPDLLVSCGKDSRSIVWNPSTGEQVGEVRLM
jgi:protein transport protein SEC31